MRRRRVLPDELSWMRADTCIRRSRHPSPGGHIVTVEAIGGRTGTMPLPVALVVLTAYHPAGRWRPRAVSPALGMLGLMDNTVAARQLPDRTMPILRAAAAGAAILRGRRGCADDMARILLAETA